MGEAARGGQFVLVLMVLVMLAAAWTARLPASLIAESTADFAQLLRLADDEFGRGRYHRAQDHLARALDLAEPEVRSDVARRLESCVAHAGVQGRYADAGFLAALESTAAPTAQALLDETLELISTRYYNQPATRDLLGRALMQLEIAVRQHRGQVATGGRDAGEAFLDALERLRGDWEGDGETLSDLCRLPGQLQPLAERAGLPAAWPALELAYALADSLDDYSHLLSPERYAAVYDRLTGAYVGIGVDVLITDAGPLVFDVTPGGPAAAAGVQPGDVLVAADGADLSDCDADLLSQRLLGPEGSPVRLTLNRGGQRLETTALRRRIAAPAVRNGRFLDAERGIAYLRIGAFQQHTAVQMRRAVAELAQAGCRGLVLDLRGNGGGLMSAAVETAAVFIDRGVIVTVRTAGRDAVYRAEDVAMGPVCRWPLVVLVDERTASAAEILAAALRDHGRAYLVGRDTFGKALVQTIVPMRAAATGLTLTTAGYFPPSGEDFHGRGIAPHRRVSATYAATPDVTILSGLQDPAIQAALAHLAAAGAGRETTGLALLPNP